MPSPGSRQTLSPGIPFPSSALVEGEPGGGCRRLSCQPPLEERPVSSLQPSAEALEVAGQSWLDG